MDKGGLGRIEKVILGGTMTSGHLWGTAEAFEERTDYFFFFD